nr:hypothetical protein [Chloroflexota bacterium]
ARAVVSRRASPDAEVAIDHAGALGLLPGLAVAASVGLLLIALADTAARESRDWAAGLFWIGLLTLVVPISARLLGAAAGRVERLGLVTLLGIGLYGVKVLHSPQGFTFFDEFLHWATLDDIVESGRLFTPNNVLPASPFYPGLEIVTSPLVSFGLPAWEAAMIVLAMARLLFVVSLFLFYERAGGSARLAGVATVVYMANPSFLTFDAQFAYESLALPMAVMVLWCVARREDGPRAARIPLTVTLFIGLVAVITTHHVTAIAMSGFLVVWAGVCFVIRRRGAAGTTGATGRRDAAGTTGVTGPALLATTATVGWILYVASVTVGYLGPAFGGALAQVVELIAGEASGRELFRTASGIPAPAWEQVFGYGSVLVVLVALPFGAWFAWRRHAADPLAMTLVLAALLYPASLVARLTQSGAELSARSAEFIFLGIGFVAAHAALVGVHLAARRSHSVRAAAVALPTLAAILFVGGAILGVPFWARLPGAYLVSADTRSVEPQSITAATWAAQHVGPDARFVADRVNRVLLKTYGDQHPLSAVGDRIDVKEVFFSTVLGGPEQRLLEAARVRYVLADHRLTTALPTVGVYVERGEVRERPHVEPLDPAALDKWDEDPRVDRVFDSGDVRIHDVARLTGAGP